MGIKEFLGKTCLFIIVPGMLIYGCLRGQDDTAHYQREYRACIATLKDPAVRALTITKQVEDGHLVHRRFSDTAAIRKIRVLARELRPIRLQYNTYRLSIYRYRLMLETNHDTCEFIFRSMPAGRADLLEGVGDSAYEAPKFIPYLDSLFIAKKPTSSQPPPAPAPRFRSSV